MTGTCTALTHGSSVNLIAPRRMGKTSLLNHLRGHPARWLPPRPDHPPRLLAAIDLQGHITGANRFYTAALRALWSGLPVWDRPPDGSPTPYSLLPHSLPIFPPRFIIPPALSTSKL